MGFASAVALRYLRSKKRNMISISTALAVGGVTLGVAAFTIAMSVTGGFLEQFREKVLGVNAHVLVLKYSIDFREYRDVMAKIENVAGIIGIAPFVINPMMVTHGEHTATGVLLKGVDPDLMPKVLDLPKHVTRGSLAGLRSPGAKPPERPYDALREQLDRRVGDDADAGTESLLRAIRREVEDGMRDKETAGATRTEDATGPDAAQQARAVPSAPRAALRAGAPRMIGAVTPDGGYKSQLPDDDDL